MNEPIDITDVLFATPRFARLSPESIEWLTSRIQILSFAAGEIIFHAEDPCDTFYFICKGAVKVSRKTDQGRESIFGLFEKGSTIGEVVLFDAQPFPADATCTKDTIVATLSRRQYLEAYKDIPDFAMATVRELMVRNRELRQRIDDLGSGTVEDRLLSVMRTFARDYGRKVPEGIELPRNISRHDLANLVHSRYETVIRALKKLEKRGDILERNDTLVLSNTILD